MLDGDGSVQSKTNPHKAGKRGNCVPAQHLQSLIPSVILHQEKTEPKNHRVYVKVLN